MAEENKNLDVQPDILQSIVDSESNKSNSENILDIAPDIDSSLLQGLEPQKNIQLILFKSIFMFLLVFAFLSFLFFQSQLNPKFNFLTSSFHLPNATENLKATNEDVINIQTDLNFYRLLQISSYLNELSFFGDAYIQNFEIFNSQTSTESDKKLASENLKSLRDSIYSPYEKVSKLVVQPFYIPVIDPELMSSGQSVQEFDSRLTNKFNEAAASVNGEMEAKIYGQSQKLIASTNLRNLITSTDFAALSDKDLYIHLKAINSVIVNDLSLIQDIKDARVKWSDIMNEIDLRTVEVDSNYSDNYYDLRGGIRYTSYDFDKVANRISIVGEVMRYDTTNFTMIANLIDAFNKSDIFEGAEMKSFSKSGSLDDGYRSNVRLNLGLTKLNYVGNTN